VVPLRKIVPVQFIPLGQEYRQWSPGLCGSIRSVEAHAKQATRATTAPSTRMPAF